MLFGHLMVQICVAFGMMLPGNASLAPMAFTASVDHANIDRMETTALPPRQDPVLQPPPPIEFGVYDPADAFKSATDFRIEHIFVAWEPFDAGKLRQKANEAAKRGRDLMVTVEPWPKASRMSRGGDAMLREIAQSRYDSQIDRVCSELARSSGRTLLRWGHEMEAASDRYPWAHKDPASFVAAFRHVVQRCRKLSPTTLIVWSPRGDGDLRKYYPGPDYVDYVGVSLWGLQKWDRKHGGRDRAFREVFWETYRNVVAYAKPVIISELGISGDEGYVDRWLTEILDRETNGAKFPLLRTIVYFNDKEPHYWPKGFGSPDWRVDPTRFAALP
jgi:beta-mannanase